MSVAVPIQARPIQLLMHDDCVQDAGCEPFAEKLYDQLSSGRYEWPVSILRLEDFESYLAEHRTARKRAARARGRFYVVRPLDRERYADDITLINRSLVYRQGRPMSPAYMEEAHFLPETVYECPRHRIEPWGIFKGGRCWGYLVLYVSGDLCMVSQILGHGHKLEDEIMYHLFVTAMREQPLPITVFYNRHDSGTDGLRFFKERLGFRPERVEWLA